jgi:hypothetical protein
MFSSCFFGPAKSPEDLMVGCWQFNNVIYESEISPETKPIIEAQIAALRQTFSVDYMENNTYHSHSFKDEKGKWQLSEDGKLLVHFFKEGEQKYKVLKLTNDSLHLKTTLQDQTLTLQFVRKK